MTFAYSKVIPTDNAPLFCSALMAGIAFRTMLNAAKAGRVQDACSTYYDNRRGPRHGRPEHLRSQPRRPGDLRAEQGKT